MNKRDETQEVKTFKELALQDLEREVIHAQQIIPKLTPGSYSRRLMEEHLENLEKKIAESQDLPEEAFIPDIPPEILEMTPEEFRESQRKEFDEELSRTYPRAAFEAGEHTVFSEIAMDKTEYKTLSPYVETLFTDYCKQAGEIPSFSDLFLEGPHAEAPLFDEWIKQARAIHILEERRRMSNISSTTLTGLVNDVILHSANLERYREQQEDVSHGTKYEIRANGNQRTITRRKKSKRGTTEESVYLPDITKVIKNSEPASDLFVFLLMKANEQAFKVGGKTLIQDYVTFSLQELVDKGFSGSLQAARNKVDKAYRVLSALQVGSCTRKTSKGKEKGEEEETDYRLKERTLFTGRDIDNSEYIVYLNDKITNWTPITEFVAAIPPYYFELSAKAKILLMRICTQARLNTGNIRKRGYFTISCRAIQAAMGLPDEHNTKNPQRDIKDKISNAVDEIEEKNAQVMQSYDLQLLPRWDEEDKISSFLDNGYLQVTINGKWKDTLVSIAETRERRIESAAKRKDKIRDAALTSNLAKAIAQQDTTTAPDPVTPQNPETP